MVERVQIRGGNLDGAVLENAATEATLRRLAAAMERRNGPGTGNRVADAYTRSLGIARTSTSALGSAMGTTTRAIGRFSSGLLDFAGKGLGLVLSGATFAVRSFTNFLTSSFANYREIADTGVTFGNSMTEVSRVALTSGMSMREFTDMVRRNTTVLTTLGGTASSGAQRLAQLRNEIINSDIGTRFFGLGLTARDIEEYMGGFFDQMQRFGSLQRRDNATLTRGVAAYVEELDKVSKLTGAERRRLDQQARRIALDPVFDSIRRGLDPEQLAKSSANLAMVAEIGGNELEEAIKELATGVITSDLAKGLTRYSAITREEALALAQGTAEAGPIMQRALGVLNSLPELGNRTLLQANAGLRALNDQRMRLSRLDSADFQRAQEEQRRRESLTEAFGKVTAIFSNLRNRFLGAIVESRAFQTMLRVLERMANQMLRHIDPVIRYFENLFNSISEVFDREGLVAALRFGFERIFGDITRLLPANMRSITDIFKEIENIGSRISERISSVIRTDLGFDTEKIKQDIENFFRTRFFPSLFTGMSNSLGNLDLNTLVIGGLAGLLTLLFLPKGLLFAALGAAALGLGNLLLDGIRSLFRRVIDIFNNVDPEAARRQAAAGRAELTQRQQAGASPGAVVARNLYETNMNDLETILRTLETAGEGETPAVRSTRERLLRELTRGSGRPTQEMLDFVRNRGTAPAAPSAPQPPAITRPDAADQPRQTSSNTSAEETVERMNQTVSNLATQLPQNSNAVDRRLADLNSLTATMIENIAELRSVNVKANETLEMIHRELRVNSQVV